MSWQTISDEWPATAAVSPRDAAKPAREVYRNLQVIGTMDAGNIRLTMSVIAASLGVNCEYCHAGDEWDSDNKPAKKTARDMLRMFDDLPDVFRGGEGAGVPVLHLPPGEDRAGAIGLIGCPRHYFRDAAFTDRVGSAPSHVTSAVRLVKSIWDRPIEKPQIHGELRAVMRRVEHATPEDPRALARHIEERHHTKPPGLGLRRKERQPRARKLDQPVHMRINGSGCRQHCGGRRLRQPEKLSEETPRREMLVLETVAHRRRFRMWTIVEVRLGERAPDRGGLERFARVCVEQMLDERHGSARYSDGRHVVSIRSG